MSQLRELVFENLRAVDNHGHYDDGFWDWPSADIAAELAAWAEDLMPYEAEEMVPHVQEYLAEKAKGPLSNAT